jgi:hypothetical protein
MKVQILTQKALRTGGARRAAQADTAAGGERHRARESGGESEGCGGGARGPGPQFTCFTGTKVQILTQKALQRRERRRSSVYLLYWHKSTNTDAEGAAERERRRYSVYLLSWYNGAHFTCFTGTKVHSFLAVLVQRYSFYLLDWYKRTNTDAQAFALLVQKCKY